MLSVFIGLLTVVFVINCLLLVLLVLVQLPKKDAGAGMAFGGGAAEAIFGAGSGTALSRITKWVAAGFFILALTLSVLGSHQKRAARSELQEQLRRETPAAPATTTTPAPASPGQSTPTTPAPPPAESNEPAPSATPEE